MALLENRPVWTLSEKIAFRFCCIFFTPFILPVPYELLTPIIGRIFFGINTLASDPNGGSGDSQFDWVSAFSILLVALIGTLIWSVLDKKRASYNQVKYVLDLLVRYYLIVNMLQYGIIKIVGMGQMPAPTETRLWQRVGDMSPMGMLWTFIGCSPAYQIFCGAMEVLAGLLLFFRRTLLLGALVSIGVMLQVFVLNMCYDVPVKIFSFFLLLCAIYLSTPFLRQVYAFFIENKATVPHVFFEITDKKWFHNLGLALKIAFVALVSYLNFESMESEDESPKLAIDGNYLVASASRQIDTAAWTSLNVRSDYEMFIAMNEDLALRSRWKMNANDTTKMLTISSFKNEDSIIARLHYTQTDANHLALNGVWAYDSLSLNLTRRPKRNFLLVNRGFHWINNEPFNR
jgi:hypothetical protein